MTPTAFRCIYPTTLTYFSSALCWILSRVANSCLASFQFGKRHCNSSWWPCQFLFPWLITCDLFRCPESLVLLQEQDSRSLGLEELLETVSKESQNCWNATLSVNSHAVFSNSCSRTITITQVVYTSRFTITFLALCSGILCKLKHYVSCHLLASGYVHIHLTLLLVLAPVTDFELRTHHTLRSSGIRPRYFYLPLYLCYLYSFAVL
jgi:hypothetical protein